MYDKPLINGTYKVIGLCGSGSYAKVYRVQHVVSNEIYACKEICYTNMGAKERGILEQEVNIVTTLVHSHIIRHHEIIHDKVSEVLYVIMEFCPNGDLSGVIMNAKRAGNYLSETYILNIIKQVLEALVYCHSPFKYNPATQKGAAGTQGTGGADDEDARDREGDTGASVNAGAGVSATAIDSTHLQPKIVLHRDIKPANLLVNHAGAVKLADFGFCRVLNSTTDMTTTRAGTPLYMAPELLDGKGYTAKADIWSLGITVYEICALRLPYTSPTIDELRRCIYSEPRKPLPNCYSEKLTSIVDLMLTIDPVARPTAAMVLEYITYIYSQAIPGIQGSDRAKQIFGSGSGVVAPETPQQGTLLNASSASNASNTANVPAHVKSMAHINTYGLRAVAPNAQKLSDRNAHSPLLSRDAIRAVSAAAAAATKQGPINAMHLQQSATIKKLQEDIFKLSEKQKTANMELLSKSNEILVLKEQLKTAKLTSQRNMYELEQLRGYVSATYGPDVAAGSQPSYADLLAMCGQYTMEVNNLKAENVLLMEQLRNISTGTSTSPVARSAVQPAQPAQTTEATKAIETTDKGLQVTTRTPYTSTKKSHASAKSDINVECLDDSTCSESLTLSMLEDKQSENMLLDKLEQQLSRIHEIMVNGHGSILRDAQGNTMLMHAAAKGYLPLVRCLCKAQSKHHNNVGKTALILSIQGGHYACAQALMPYEKDIPDLSGKTPDLYAISSSDVQIQNLFSI